MREIDEDNLPEGSITKKARPADHMANERTFLAWIRTGIALMGFGFVIVKFGLFLKQISFVLGDKIDIAPKGSSTSIGMIMVGLGALISILAYVRFQTVEKQLNSNIYVPSMWLSTFVTVCVTIGAAILVFYLLHNF